VTTPASGLKLKDLLPSEEDWKRLQNVESALLRRKTVGTAAGLVAIATAALQVVFAVADAPYFSKLVAILSSVATLHFRELPALGLDWKKGLTLAILFGSTFLYLLLRRTRVLLKESEEAFRYTFWIEPFTRVDNAPEERFKLTAEDRFTLLHRDLIERLDQRIKRFSILDESTGTKVGDDASPMPRRAYSSHIHISGRYALRDEDGSW
jgi:hypothetical protein